MHGLPWWFGPLLNPWVWVELGLVASAVLGGLIWGLVRLVRHYR